MVDLDAVEVYRSFDPSNMIGRIGDFPRQCLKAWQGAINLSLPPDYRTVDKVVILGMGGSAIGGDLVHSLAMTQGRITVLVHRDYNLPRLVDERTLVIASSYSGDTEETLSAFSQAIHTPAKKLAITTGGKLQNLAAENGIPVFIFHYKSEPRTALGYSFFSLLAFLQKLGLIAIDTGDIDETMSVLEELSINLDKGVSLDANPAKQIATKLFSYLVIVYGAGILSKVAYRWKTQFNECSKICAYAESFPELNHNAVVGYRLPRWLNQKASIIMLRSPSLHPRTLVRYTVTGELLADAGINYEVIEAKGECPLSQMMSTVLLGDYVSYYLALLNEVDPSPVAAIDYLKVRLTKADIAKG